RFYGLNFTRMSSAAAEVTFTPRDTTFVYVSYSRDRNRLGYLGLTNLVVGAVVDTTACCAQFPIANTWDRRGNDTLDTLQFGINTAVNEGRTTIDLAYVLSNAKDQIHTINPYQILANSPLTAGAYDYPDTINRWQEIDATVAR